MTFSYRHSLTFALLTTSLLLFSGVGCDILQVDNPNSLREENIDPSTTPSLTNGAEAVVTRALGAIHAPYHTATGELTWIGSRDAWGELDNGQLDNELNEFTDAAFPYVGEAVWTVQEYIDQVQTFRQNVDDFGNQRNQVRLYLYGAIIFTSTADMFDNFVTESDREQGAPPVGPGNMVDLYDQAQTWLGNAESIIQNTGSLQGTDLEKAIYAMQARTAYSKGVWSKVNASDGSPDVNTADPYVDNQAVNLAQEALDKMSAGEDFIFSLGQSPSTPGLVVGDLSMALQINERAELGFGDRYVETEDDGTFKSVTFTDLISGDVHPYLNRFINDFVSQSQYADIPVVSQREMYLILAEAALAGNPNLDFQTQINNLRALDELPAFNGQVDEDALLRESREVNLFLQGRRLADHYRFNNPSTQWTAERNPPGTFFPITITEIRSNPNVDQ